MLSKVSLETMAWKCLVFEIQGVKVINDIIIFQTCVIIFPNMSIYVPWIWFSWKIFLEQRCTFFWWRSHSSVSSTSYIGSFQNEERSRVQICIFKGFIYRYLMLAALQTLLFTSMFDSAMHAFEAFLCMRIMPTLPFCQNMGNWESVLPNQIFFSA